MRPRRSVPLISAMAVLGLLGAGCGSGSPSTTSNTTAASVPGAGASGDKVSVKDFSFKPKDLTVKAGTVVTFTFNDDSDHTVLFTKDSGVTVNPANTSGPNESTSLKNGKTAAVTFPKAGKYEYKCGIHTYMTGSITAA